MAAVGQTTAAVGQTTAAVGQTTATEMVERELEIVNALGLHARAAAKLVHVASGFRSRVLVVAQGEEVDAKSILGLLLLAAPLGSRLLVRCDGPDEQAAIDAVTALVADRFGEGR
jgi:phosphocarrier protein